jgi:hypothetical protein
LTGKIHLEWEHSPTAGARVGGGGDLDVFGPGPSASKCSALTVRLCDPLVETALVVVGHLLYKNINMYIYTI